VAVPPAEGAAAVAAGEDKQNLLGILMLGAFVVIYLMPVFFIVWIASPFITYGIIRDKTVIDNRGNIIWMFVLHIFIFPFLLQATSSLFGE
jgi:hypothetical protein